ncbi:MAG TPA: SAM-dependent methyltransferase [Steroidobacteraceae bacterium]|nr:SAM-dependent methyltransferase [Steroidobacteraceae bacterium]
MEAHRHSQTALVMAAIRAVHHAGGPPRIFDDPLARALLTRSELEAFEERLAKNLQQLRPNLAASCLDRAATLREAIRISAAVNVLARARYTEDSLLSSLSDGIRQYVIIGAGLDTFACRHRGVADRLRVIEMDHPATHALKRARVADAGWVSPQGLQLVCVDLEREHLSAALKRSNYEAAVPALFAWLGVTPYLTRHAVVETIRSIAGIVCPGSRLIFDYFEPGAFSAQAPARLRLVLEQARLLGEPMISNLEAEALPSELAGVGFHLREDLAPSRIQDRLMPNEGFEAVAYWRLAHAIRLDI